MAVRGSGLELAFPQMKQSLRILNDVVSALLSLLGADVLSLSTFSTCCCSLIFVLLQ